MNKKVLTLCAGLILAGSFGSINALGLEKAVELNGNSGKVVGPKYYYLDRTADYNNTQSGKWGALNDGYYLKADGDDFVYVNGTRKSGDLDAYWKVEVDRVDAQGTWYKLTTASGKRLSVKYGTAPNEVTINSFLTAYNANDTNLGAEISSLYFIDPNSSNSDDRVYVYLKNTGEWVISTDESKASGFVLAEIPEEVINAADLNAVNKDGFYLNFKDYSDIQGNVFAGKLRAIPANGGKHADTYYLMNEEGKYIILTSDVWSKNTANLDGKERSAFQGYKFEAVSEHAWQTEYKENRADFAEFQILKSYDFNNTDSLIVTMPYAKVGEMPGTEDATQTEWAGEALDGTEATADDKHYEGVRVFISTVNDINYLTVIEYAKANDRLAEQQDDAYWGKNDVPYEVGASAPYIEFGKGTQVNIEETFRGKLWNITTVDGSMIMSPDVNADIDSYEQLFAPAKQVDLTNPEGQWLLNKNANGYYFVNRESGAQWPVSFTEHEGWVMRNGEVADVYEVCWYHDMNTSKWQSIIIKEAGTPGKTEKGYVNFDMAAEANNGKYMSFADALGRNVYIGKDADDNVILTEDQNEAIEFRIKQLDHDFTDHDGVAAPDTLQHYTTFLNVDKDGKTFTDVDTLQFFQYALYENFSEKYLTYDATTKNFKLSKWSRTNNGHENFDLYAADHAFVVKEKEDGTRILVRDYAIDYDYCIVDGKKNHEIDKYGIAWNAEDYTFDNIFEANLGIDAYTAKKDGKDVGRAKGFDGNFAGAHKVYAAYLTGEITDNAALYNYEDNDRITVVNTDKVEYMKITGAQDTVKIALQDQPNFFLYEQKGFLGMEHVADVEDMKAAIFVDTAYVRNETYRPQFLLAMGAEYKPEIWDNHPNVPEIPHLIAPDTTYGRFLVNMVDSAVTYKGSDKTNPYIFDRNDYYRLAFIDGYHTGDTLYLNTANKTKIALDDNNDKVCTFAFRYVDNSRTGVKIETRYNTTADDVPVRGWLKYQNNVAVVTNDYNDAHVFTVDNTTLEAPTANEEITAEGAVSVVATDGAVIIKGAEGKNVVIATILGKVVANETVNSDNETIAVPAGIAVVSVDN